MCRYPCTQHIVYEVYIIIFCLRNLVASYVVQVMITYYTTMYQSYCMVWNMFQNSNVYKQLNLHNNGFLQHENILRDTMRTKFATIQPKRMNKVEILINTWRKRNDNTLRNGQENRFCPCKIDKGIQLMRQEITRTTLASEILVCAYETSQHNLFRGEQR